MDSLEQALGERIANRVVAEVRRQMPDMIANAVQVPPRYLTAQQAGDYIGKSADAVRMMVSRKEIPGIHPGPRTLRIDRNDIDTWASRRRY